MNLVPTIAVLFLCTSCILGKELSLQHEWPREVCPCSDPKLCDRIDVRDRQEVVAYAPDLTNYKKYNWNKLTTLVVYESSLKKIGMDPVCLAHSHGTRVLIAVSITPDQLKNETARKSVITYYTTLAKGYYLDGANIDVEFSTAEIALRNGLTEFAVELKAAFFSMHNTSLVIADVFWLPNIFHNTKGLANACDFLFIMAYDEQHDMPLPCIARANAPYAQTELGVAAFIAIGVPGHKLVLGLPWYGYTYNCTKLARWDMCFIKEIGVHCTQGVGQQLSFATIMNYSNAKKERRWGKLSQSPYRNLKDNSTGVISQIWYDDTESLSLKYAFASKWNLRGVGMWDADTLNYSEPLNPETIAMWDALPDYVKNP